MYIESFFGVKGENLTHDMLEQFISSQPEENLHLEFKSGAFFDANKKDDITRAVTSFANSDGGLLIIGVKEKKTDGKSYADSIDGVQVDSKHSKEALENILISSISPKIDLLQILRLEENGRSIFILDIPKSERSPHMASDKRYYKRLNFQKIPMEHYEVEDYLYGRKKTPKLTAKFKFSASQSQNSNLEYTMEISIRNLGKTMAKYVLLVIVVRGISVVPPLPTGFHVSKQDTTETVLQYGPFSNGVVPVVIPPNPSSKEIWTTLGKLTLSATHASGLAVVQYQVMHEDLPVTIGQFVIYSGLAGTSLTNQSKEVSAPNEEVLY